MLMPDRIRNILLSTIDSLIRDDAHYIESLDKNDADIIAPFYENGHVKYPINIDDMHLDFIQLIFLLNYFQQRLDIATDTLVDLRDNKYNGSIPDYKWDTHTRTPLEQEDLRYDWEEIILPLERDTIHYSRIMPALRKMALIDINQRFNLHVEKS